MKNYVAYYRVSTQKQGISGLGLESQKDTVRRFIGDNTLFKEYTEIESGKKNNRLELINALQYAKDNKATLVIAKLDRLSRNTAFILTLRDSKVDFVCCDMPDANTLTIGIIAIIAQNERETISQRTKDALKQKKQQGFVLGTPANLTKDAIFKSVLVRKELAANNDNNKKATAFILSLKTQKKSLSEIATILNCNGFRTSKNKEFQKTTVLRLYNKAI